MNTNAFRFLLGLSLLAPACSNVPASDFLMITSPASGGELGPSQDVSDEPGIQVDVEVETSLPAGEMLTLTLTDVRGQRADWPAGAGVTADGTARFDAVTVADGAATLAVSCTEDCGVSTATLPVVAVSELGCALEVGTGPVEVDYYAPLGVLNAMSDEELAEPALQTTVRVTTSGSARVALHAVDLETGEETVTELVAEDGIADVPATLADGRLALRAHCASAGGQLELESATQVLFIDSQPPTCEMVSPVSDAVIGLADDVDENAEGVQVALMGRVVTANGDAAGEPSWFEVGSAQVDGSMVDGEGVASATATVSSPGMVSFTFISRDHAGNHCATTREVPFLVD